LKTLPVFITEAAKREISTIMDKKKIPDGYGLRLAVRGAGCSGVSFVIGFDKSKEGDEIFCEDSIPVFIEKKHFMHLIGSKVDFIDTASERGFVFSSRPD
jgi:iron-sulfur cluster assembly protein